MGWARPAGLWDQMLADGFDDFAPVSGSGDAAAGEDGVAP